MTYNILDNDDLAMLSDMTQAAIVEGRKADDVKDDDLARLYSLKGKLAKLRSGRGNGATEPKKERKIRTKKTATPEPATGA